MDSVKPKFQGLSMAIDGFNSRVSSSGFGRFFRLEGSGHVRYLASFCHIPCSVLLTASLAQGDPWLIAIQ